MHTLTTEQVKRGYWYYRPDSKFPPRCIRSPDEYAGGERLAVACTQLGNASLQRRLVKSWCDTLPRLTALRFLWFNSRVPQELFDSACKIPGLKGLYIKWSGIKSVAELLDAQQLQFLHIGSSPSIGDPEVFGRLSNLIVLNLENIRTIASVDVLHPLPHIEELHLEGSMWTTQVVESLAPLSRLRTLRRLSLTNLRARDRHSLRALAALPALTELCVALWWPQEDIDHVLHSLPTLRINGESST